MVIRQKINGFVYRVLVKPILFKFDPEVVHDSFVSIGESLGSNILTKTLTKSFFSYNNKVLNQNVLGINFSNPIGLSAGFDYNGRLTQILPSVGFGFSTIGSITRGSYEGNPKPRLLRLPNSKSILVNKGLKNLGAKKIVFSLKNKAFSIPLGVSVAKTNCERTVNEAQGINDYFDTLKLLVDNGVGDFYEINVSCPNAFGGEPFTTPKKLNKLLSKIDKLDISKPVFLKMPTDLSIFETKGLCEVALKHNVSGLIFGNLTKNRDNPRLDKSEVALLANRKGALSGLPTKELSNRLIAFAYKNYGKRFVIIGCGGVFTAIDAYEKIKLGATLIQLITGMIYNGPSVISEINEGLAKLLANDGYDNISQAIGVDNK
ncbi:MAG: quinone-dependent dihydroorotate dehydrogenase [Nanoarchaeota archaeon]